MKSQCLMTYRNINELRRILSEQEVHPFMFAETKETLEYNPDAYVDISCLIYLLQDNKVNMQAAYVNLNPMGENSHIIIHCSLAESAISLLPYLFSEYKPYFEEDNSIEIPQNDKNTYTRQTIYKYNNEEELNRTLEYIEKHQIPFATFSRANGDMKGMFDKFNRTIELCLLDLTSVSYAIEDNKNLIYLIEQFFCIYPNIKVLSLTSQVDILLKYFPLFLNDQKPVSELLPELKDIGEKKEEDIQIKKVVDLTESSFNTFIEYFTHNLIGHKNFKLYLEETLRDFRILNKVNEQKVLSVFLFGSSGIGKTEVARLLAEGLEKEGYLPKINFQNYSSQDALNSLIGSPAGYIGCNHGELSEKISKSNIGVLLCDEFEKTTRPVFSFFLELLEEGKFTDSMAREYDMNGYVIVFTSNIQSEEEYKKIIPPELQTRFDLVCEFQEPSSSEKREFLDLLLEKAKTKFVTQFSQINISEEEKEKLYEFEYSNLHALRDIKRIFNKRLIDFFKTKGVKLS